MKEFTHEIKIPKERVGVLIGKDGEIKKQVEESTDTKLDIDSKEGNVTISADDGLKLYDAKEIVRAIARGFNPETAFLLLKTDYTMEVVDMRDFAGKSKTTMVRLKGRVIGRQGKSKKEIETLTETQISVYGKTVAIVGRVEDVPNARKAVENLLQGATYSSVFTFLEKKRRERHLEQVE